MTIPSYAEKTTLNTALIQAYKNSNQLRIIRASLRRVDEGVVIQRSAQKPTISGNAGITRRKDLLGTTGTNTQKSISITANQLLYDGGQSKMATKAAHMSVLATRQALISTEQDVLLQAVTAFFNVQRDQKSVGLAHNNIRVLREQVRAAENRFNVGEVTQTDVSQAKARLSAATSRLEDAKGNLQNSRQFFHAKIGISPTVLQVPKSMPKLPTSIEDAEAFALKNHPRVLQEQFNVKAAQYQYDKAKHNRSIKINAELRAISSRGNAFGADNDNLTATVFVNVPIYSGGRLDSEQRTSLATLQSAQAKVQINAIITRQNIANAYTNWRTSITAKKAVKSQIDSAQLALNGVREEANLGARTTLDILNAEQELLRAQSSLISANYNQFITVYTVLSEMGLLTVDHLNLGVKQYDPNVNYIKVNGKKNTLIKKSRLGDKRKKIFDKLMGRY